NLYIVLFPHVDQCGVVEARAVVELTRFVERDAVAEDFNLPGVRSEPGLDQVIAFETGGNTPIRARGHWFEKRQTREVRGRTRGGRRLCPGPQGMRQHLAAGGQDSKRQEIAA